MIFPSDSSFHIHRALFYVGFCNTTQGREAARYSTQQWLRFREIAPRHHCFGARCNTRKCTCAVFECSTQWQHTGGGRLFSVAERSHSYFSCQKRSTADFLRRFYTTFGGLNFHFKFQLDCTCIWCLRHTVTIPQNRGL